MKFKPEWVGKPSFYLSVVDDLPSLLTILWANR